MSCRSAAGTTSPMRLPPARWRGLWAFPIRRSPKGCAVSMVAHRVQLVASRNGVDWYDDSKGTNVGATVTAVRGLGTKTVLILGGDGKGQDFSPLAEPVSQFARRVLLIGRDAPRIAAALNGSGVQLEDCGSLEEAVEKALRNAAPGDASC